MVNGSEERQMDAPSFGRLTTAMSLLAQAKQESSKSGELLRQILAGTHQIDSWLIEQRIIPRLRQQNARTLRFTDTAQDKEGCSAVLVPLVDGSAFARSTSAGWSVLEPLEALSAIEYIGFRYAPENSWTRGFEASLQAGDQAPDPVDPFGVATIWQEITGSKPAGFAAGALDQIEALGLQLIGRIFNTHGRLGL